MSNAKVAYKEIKAKQTADLKSKTSRYMIYRRFSTPFTYVFVKLGFSPITVSILNFIPPIIGYFFMAAGNYLFMIFGILCFILFKVLDCSDGEVARIQNPKAMDNLHKGIEGPYFDGFAHFIYSTCFGMGLGVGMFRLYSNEIYLTLGMFLTLFFVLDRAFIELIISSYRKAIINRGITITSDKPILARIINEMHNGRSWSENNIFLRLAGVLPFQGLIYTAEYVPIILITLAIMEFFISQSIEFPVFYGITFSMLTIYLSILAIEKFVYYANFVFNLKKNMYITKVIEEMQKG